MTQDQAIKMLADILGRDPARTADCTGDTMTCQVDECMICGVRDCPYNEPLHYHHDGCPACWTHSDDDDPKYSNVTGSPGQKDVS